METLLERPTTAEAGTLPPYGLSVAPTRIIGALWVVLAVLVAANLTGIVVEWSTGHDNVYGLLPLFDFNTERNVPTFFSSVLLACSALLLLALGRLHGAANGERAPWIWLGGIMAFLAVDESASIHERLTAPVREALGASGIIYYAWVLPYSVLLVVLLLALRGFLLRLDRVDRRRILTAGGVFVLGAIGVELLSGVVDESRGKENLAYALLYTVEETLELCGVILFIRALLIHWARQFPRVLLRSDL